MSAAAGISAAKKRRGIVSTGPETPSQNSKQGQGGPQPMVTPIQILQNHELRIKHIERQLNDAEDYANSMVESSQSQQPQQQQQLAQPQVQVPSLDTLLVQEYKTKCDTLERKVEELTALVQKVQTFSMESNLAFLKMKRVMDEDFENRIQQLKQSYVSDENMIQAIKFDTAAALSSMSANTLSFENTLESRG